MKIVLLLLASLTYIYGADADKVVAADGPRQLSYTALLGTGVNEGINVSQFTWKETASSPQAVIRTDTVDPFMEEVPIVGILGDKEALVLGTTTQADMLLEFHFNPFSLTQIVPCILPSVDKEAKKVAFESWQTRTGYDSQTAVVNIWQLQGNLQKTVVYPPANALTNNPEPWVDNQSHIEAIVSPLSWDKEGERVAFVVRRGKGYDYDIIIAGLDAKKKPVLGSVSIPLGEIVYHDAKYFLGTFSFRVTAIDWSGCRIKITMANQAFLKMTDYSTTVPTIAELYDPKQFIDMRPSIQGQRVLRFSKTVVDLGKIDAKIHHFSFTYTNPNKEDVSILSGGRSCSCLTLDEYDPIVPAGATGSIGGTIDLTNIAQPLAPNITLLLGSSKAIQSTVLTIRASPKF